MRKLYPREFENIKNLNKIELSDLFKNMDFVGALLKVGNYYEQDIYTIMQTKMYDIKNVGYCLWTFGSISLIETIEESARFLEDNGAKYVIMPLTESTSKGRGIEQSMLNGESIEEYDERMRSTLNANRHANNIILPRTRKMLNYPTELMPEIVSGTKNENAAYVFSDFYISNEDIEDSELSSIFETFAKGGIYKDCCFGNSCTHALVRQKKLMNRNIEKSEGITFIVGKLKEPYIVQVIG
ncbi:hypothetical protein [Anaerococcus vaginalis]|nr:hypothetical protein [Anaerococcus vaginalis]MDU5560600.1 hypothetical protein [Anaerococcus vaginalis]